MDVFFALWPVQGGHPVTRFAAYPHPKDLVIDEILSRPDVTVVCARGSAGSSRCPSCQALSSRVHSRYLRRVSDLPRFGIPVTLHIRCRRFFCDNKACKQRTFAESLGDFVPRHARRSARLTRALRAFAIVCGGEAGSKLAGVLGIPTSGDTLLRVLRATPDPPSEPVRVLGVDDWAIRRGQNYGTILCDLERRRVIDLLPDRSMETLREWLRQHAEIETVSRDRAGAYARAVLEGAPAAVQVADRWHIMKNLSDHLLRILDRFREEIAVANERDEATSESPATPEKTAPKTKPAVMTASRARRLLLYEKVIALHRSGRSIRSIARELGMHRGTVTRFLSSDGFPERKVRRSIRSTDKFEVFLRRRWAEGCHNARQLADEIKRKGFKRSYACVRRLVAPWRLNEASQKMANGNRDKRVSAKQATWLLQTPDEELSEREAAFVTKLEDESEPLASLRNLSLDFRAMMRQHQGDSLAEWVARAADSPLRGFAQGLEADFDAVKSAFQSEWSNGQTEGQVNRLKVLKRQMYGRATLKLLRKRLICSLTQIA